MKSWRGLLDCKPWWLLNTKNPNNEKIWIKTPCSGSGWGSGLLDGMGWIRILILAFSSLWLWNNWNLWGKTSISTINVCHILWVWLKATGTYNTFIKRVAVPCPKYPITLPRGIMGNLQTYCVCLKMKHSTPQTFWSLLSCCSQNLFCIPPEN